VETTFILSKTYRKTIRTGGGKVLAYWFPASIFSTLVDAWVVRSWLAGGGKGGGKEGGWKMKMKTGWSLATRHHLYGGEDTVHRACAQQNLNINLHHSVGAWRYFASDEPRG
jgi:hypothetical protein